MKTFPSLLLFALPVMMFLFPKKQVDVAIHMKASK